MATRVSAGVYINERDLSQYAVQLGLASLAIVGAATKGPLHEATSVTNESDLVRTFGPPVPTDYGLHAAIRFLRKGNNLQFLRVADTDPTTGAIEADLKVYGGQRAEGAIEFLAGAQPADGDTAAIGDGLDTLAYGTLVSKFATGEVVTGSVSEATGIVVTDTGAAMRVVPLTGTFAVADVLTGGTSGATASITVYTPAAPVTFTFVTAAPADPTEIQIGATSFDTMSGFLAAIAASTLEIDATDTSDTVVPSLALLHREIGAAGNVAISVTGAVLDATGMAGGTDPGTELATIFAASPGTWGNDISIEIVKSQVLGAASTDRDLFVFARPEPGQAKQRVEQFRRFSLDPESPRFIEAMLNEGIVGEVGPSAYIVADVYPAGSVSGRDNGVLSVGAFNLGSIGNQSGRDGIENLSASDVIGTVSGQIPTGLKALFNPERIEFNLINVAGWTHTSVIDEVIRLCDSRGDCLALLDAPFGLDRDQVIEWHNGTSVGIPNAPTSPINSNRAALFWAWQYDYDPYSKANLWLPPGGFVAANISKSDEEAFPWFAFAGHNRGILGSKDTEYSPDQDDRDLLCPVNGQNAVNPIVKFKGQGPTIFGNKTLQRDPSALTSIHVRRMLLYAQKTIATAVKYLVFEPNEPVTWRRFTLLVNPILENIASNRGLEEFQVICDESTNPAQQRNQKTMRAKLFMTPVNAAERIELDFTVFAAGASFDEAA